MSEKPQFNTPFIPVLITTALLIAPTMQSTALAEENSRYTMIETDDGIIRLDKQTGSMSNCKKSFESWACEPMREMSEDQKSTSSGEENEQIAALRIENLKLKQRLADLEQLNNSPDDRGLDSLKPDGLDKDKKFKLPSDEEVDEAITYMEKMIRKFGGAMKRLREERYKDPQTEL